MRTYDVAIEDIQTHSVQIAQEFGKKSLVGTRQAHSKEMSFLGHAATKSQKQAFIF